jgi:protein-disulfide isomerase
LLEKNPTTLKIVYKNFPLRSHQMSVPAAEAAMAANEQGRFWDFHDRIFSYLTSPSKQKLDEKELAQIPVTLGLDMPRFLASMKKPAIKQLISRDLQEGQKAGVTGTPTLFLNGRKIENRSPQGIQQMIDQELQKLQLKPAR